MGIARRRGQCLGQFIRCLLSLLFLAPLFGFFNLIFHLSKVLQNSGCRLFAFLLILDQLVDLCDQIIRALGLAGLGGLWFFGAAFGGVGFVVGVFTFCAGFGFGRAFGSARGFALGA